MLTDERIGQLTCDPRWSYIETPLLALFARAIESEVRAEAQEPVAHVTEEISGPKKLSWYSYKAMYDTPVWTKLYTAPQPPAPCPKCAENEKTLQAIAEHVDWAFIGDLDDVVASRINERNDAVAYFAAERDALQAKAAELEKKSEDACRLLQYRTNALSNSEDKVAEQSAEIQRLEKVALFKESVSAMYVADIDHQNELANDFAAQVRRQNTTIAELQAKVAELEQQCSDLEDERDDAEHQPWPEWSESILKIIRKRSGHDGFDDADGIDLPEELRELLAGNDAEFDREHAKLVAANERIAEQAALIERCEVALAAMISEARARNCGLKIADEALAAIAAHKGERK